MYIFIPLKLVYYFIFIVVDIHTTTTIYLFTHDNYIFIIKFKF